MADHPRRTHAVRRSADGAKATAARLRNRAFLAALGLVVIIAGLSTVGGTYAFWTDEATMDGGTLTTGTAVLEAKWTSEGAGTGTLLPGDSFSREVELLNDGDVALEISLSGTVDSPGIVLNSAAGSCGDGHPMQSFGAEASPLPSAGDRPGTLTVDPGSTSRICVAVEATEDLEPGRDSSFTIRIEGKQAQ